MRVNRPALAFALRRFAERVRRASARNAREALERRLERDMTYYWQAQKQLVLTRMPENVKRLYDARAGQLREAVIKPSVDPAKQVLAGSVVQYLLSGSGPGTSEALEDLLMEYAKEAFLEGIKQALQQFAAELEAMGFVARPGQGGDIFNFGIGFSMTSTDALIYAEQFAAARVTAIDEVTRGKLREVLVEALEEGLSWKDTAKRIAELYDGFSGPPLFPNRTYVTRAEAIASFEIGDAYVAGAMSQINQIAAVTGWEMEKAWVNAGDERVREAHRQNAAAGWQGAAAVFPGDNALRPPTDPGCRCDLIWRRKGSTFITLPEPSYT